MAKIPEASAAAREEVGGLGSWHARLVRFDRVQCVLFCHDETRRERVATLAADR